MERTAPPWHPRKPSEHSGRMAPVLLLTSLCITKIASAGGWQSPGDCGEGGSRQWLPPYLCTCRTKACTSWMSGSWLSGPPFEAEVDLPCGEGRTPAAGELGAPRRK